VPVIVNSILQNAGQTCSAGSRLLVEDSVHDTVVKRIAEIFAGVDIGPALDDPSLGPLISGPQRDRVCSFLTAPDRGGHVTLGGETLSGGRYGNGYFFQPTLVDDVHETSVIFREEVFGPVLAVTSFADIDQATALANATDYGLIAGVWTSNISIAQRMIRDMVCGQVFVNTYGASGGVELPFGGFKRSGFGREKGAEGLRGFAQVKTAVIAA
jgi:aldehyde dehydrogenase (NAD+)